MDNGDSIVQAYSQSGGDLSYFVGKQYGAGWLRTLGRIAFPIFKKLINVAGNTAEDVLVREKPVLSSLRDNALQEVSDTFLSKSDTPKASINSRQNLKRRSSSSASRNTTAPPLLQQQKRRRHN